MLLPKVLLPKVLTGHRPTRICFSLYLAIQSPSNTLRPKNKALILRIRTQNPYAELKNPHRPEPVLRTFLRELWRTELQELTGVQAASKEDSTFGIESKVYTTLY